MQGRWQPVLFMGVTTLVPLLAWLGGAALALVTLRRGPLEGFVTMAAASLALGVGLAAMGANPVVSALGVLEYWGPVYVLAWVLRVTVSLPLAMMASAAMAAVVLVGWHVLVTDPVAFWERSLGPLAQGENATGMMEALLPVMSGYWVLGLWSLVLGSLLLGRWWQALLYNPGGFRAEFHALRLDWRLGAAALAAMLGATFTGPGLVHDLSLLASGVFTIQALAVAHGLRAVTGWHRAVLIPVYVLLPFLFKLYALAGIADTWFDLRARWRHSSGSGG
ncbi:hypothetical protein QWY84_16990 [Aquisalimonas lutea]|uniref:hypothetical protein n=1 Tax=Aquisalimonas lutea TaxID=1327750 RepID=UPI0025B5D410|nr:hypothetical protein [Aquisalimonas lutea]MDN3519310.1 hypothetical protein [Aquisalimonas lutea]